MTLQSSGAISLSDIRAEFSDSAPDSLSEYYGRGTPPLPSSGAIAFSDFYGVSAEVVGDVTVSGETITDIGGGNRLFRAALRVDNNGNIYKIEDTTVTQIDTVDDWIRPTSDASSSYDVKYDFVSGDALDPSTSLADGVWGALGADKFFEQRWALGAGVGSKSTVITISIRFLGGSVLDSANYTLTAERII